MTKFVTLSSSKEFQKIYCVAKKWHCDGAVVYFLADKTNKFAVVASKKIGNAVARNRAKRRIRAAFLDLNNAVKSGIYVIVAKNGVNDLNFANPQKTKNTFSKFAKFENNLKWSFKKIDALK